MSLTRENHSLLLVPNPEPDNDDFLLLDYPTPDGLDRIRAQLQFYVNVDREEWKLDTLIDLLEVMGGVEIIVFCNTRRKAAALTDSLIQSNIAAGCVTLDLSAAERDDVMRGFRDRGPTRVIVAGNMGVRDFGEDANIARLFVNYDLPNSHETFAPRAIHRNGLGPDRLFIHFVTNEEYGTLRGFEGFYGMRIDELPINFADLI